MTEELRERIRLYREKNATIHGLEAAWVKGGIEQENADGLNSVVSDQGDTSSCNAIRTAEEISLLVSRLDSTKCELGRVRNRLDLLILLVAVAVLAVFLLVDSVPL